MRVAMCGAFHSNIRYVVSRRSVVAQNILQLFTCHFINIKHSLSFHLHFPFKFLALSMLMQKQSSFVTLRFMRQHFSKFKILTTYTNN